MTVSLPAERIERDGSHSQWQQQGISKQDWIQCPADPYNVRENSDSKSPTSGCHGHVHGIASFSNRLPGPINPALSPYGAEEQSCSNRKPGSGCKELDPRLVHGNIWRWNPPFGPRRAVRLTISAPHLGHS